MKKWTTLLIALTLAIYVGVAAFTYIGESRVDQTAVASTTGDLQPAVAQTEGLPPCCAAMAAGKKTGRCEEAAKAAALGNPYGCDHAVKTVVDGQEKVGCNAPAQVRKDYSSTEATTAKNVRNAAKTGCCSHAAQISKEACDKAHATGSGCPAVKKGEPVPEGCPHHK
jgi:hypothetical protein